MEFLGFVTSKQKKKLLMESAVFCLPTRYPTEAQPISLIEALCMGCTIVATDLPGILDTLGESYPKELFVEKDTQDIKKVLDMIYSDPDSIYEKISANMKSYHESFSLSRFAKKIYESVY